MGCAPSTANISKEVKESSDNRTQNTEHNKVPPRTSSVTSNSKKASYYIQHQEYKPETPHTNTQQNKLENEEDNDEYESDRIMGERKDSMVGQVGNSLNSLQDHNSDTDAELDAGSVLEDEIIVEVQKEKEIITDNEGSTTIVITKVSDEPNANNKNDEEDSASTDLSTHYGDYTEGSVITNVKYNTFRETLASLPEPEYHI